MDNQIIEAARASGDTNWQPDFQCQVEMALPKPQAKRESCAQPIARTARGHVDGWPPSLTMS